MLPYVLSCCCHQGDAFDIVGSVQAQRHTYTVLIAGHIEHNGMHSPVARMMTDHPQLF